MHEHFRHHTSQEEAEKTNGKPEICPVMSILHHFQCIALEVHGAIEVHLVESLHGDLGFAMVFGPVLFAVELEVMFHWSSGKSGLFVLSWGYGGGEVPKGRQDGNASEDSKENPCEEPPIDLSGKVGRDQGQKSTEENVGEIVAASRVCRKRSILDRRIL